MVIDLKALEGIDLSVQAIFADINDDGSARMLNLEQFVLEKTEGSKLYYSLNHKLNIPGVYNFGIRMFPVYKDLSVETDMCCVRWI